MNHLCVNSWSFTNDCNRFVRCFVLEGVLFVCYSWGKIFSTLTNVNFKYHDSIRELFHRFLCTLSSLCESCRDKTDCTEDLKVPSSNPENLLAWVLNNPGSRQLFFLILLNFIQLKNVYSVNFTVFLLLSGHDLPQ